jgi:hypothetical protein
MADNYNKIITTLNSVSSNYTFIPDQDNVIVIDTSENRIGINTVNPDHAIHVSGGTILTKDLICINLTSTNPALSSDDRLKHNEVDIVNGLQIIRQLVPQQYQKTLDLKAADYTGALTDGTWRMEAGLIAQDILQITDLSFCVGGGDKVDTAGNIVEQAYNLNYNNIFTYGIAATKELDAIVQTQQTAITTLQQENATLKSALNELLSAAGKPTI